MPKTYHSKVLIIGSGPAGYTAAVYAARANLKPILVAGMQPGGQMTTTSEVENFPAFTSIDGTELMELMKKQAEHFDTQMVDDIITSVDLKSNPKKAISDSGDTYLADTVILATGAQAKWLNMPGEERYKGKGVSACATCDGFFHKGKEVVVIGGGNTAVEEALFLANFSSKVTVVHRRDAFRAEKIMQDRLFANPKINVIWDSVLDEVVGNKEEKDESKKVVAGVEIRNLKTGKITELNASGVFIAIGHKPASEIFKGQIDIDTNGYVITKPDSTATNIPGVFAAGDLRDHVFRQAVTAAGDGCKAALEADRYLHLAPTPEQKNDQKPAPKRPQV